MRRHPEELRVLYHLLYVSIILALFLLFLTVSQKQAAFSSAGYASGAAVIIGLLLMPLLIAVREELMLFKLNGQTDKNSSPAVFTPEMKTSSSSTTKNNESLSPIEEIPELNSPTCCSNIVNKPERGEDFSEYLEFI
uniref:Nodulin-like domain-containing protein n=1 Tax=Cucumis sativus TaxID=3659 RepID=A0A0A0LVC9_CUCSA